MLQFSSNPPMTSTRYALRLLRTPTKGNLHLIATCDDLVGCWTHFYSGRTMPCTGEGCTTCDAGASSRWHAYLSVFHPDTSEHALFECTTLAAQGFANYRVKNGSLRGCEFTAKRVAPRANARVHLQMRPADLTKLELPNQPNIQAALCHMWGIPITQTDIALAGNAALTIAPRADALSATSGNGDKPAA